MSQPTPTGPDDGPREIPAAEGDSPGGPGPAAAPAPVRAGSATGEGPSAPLRAALVLAFLATASLGVLRVHERMRDRDAFRVFGTRVRVVDLPAWLPAEEAAALGRAAGAAEAPSIRTAGLPEAVAARVAADPRVAGIVSTRRLHPNAVEVVAELRRPVALVEAAGRLYAVDRAGIRVPGDYGGLDLPRIRGGGPDVPRPGLPFDASVTAGASVAAALPADLAAALGLGVIDVREADGEDGVRILRGAAGGGAPVTVEWGRPPCSPRAGLDPDPAGKVALLRLAAERFPGLRGLRTVRLRFDSLVVVPL